MCNKTYLHIKVRSIDIYLNIYNTSNIYNAEWINLYSCPHFVCWAKTRENRKCSDVKLTWALMFSLEGSVAVNFLIYNPTIADNLRQKINFLKIRGEEHSTAARSGEVQTSLYTGTGPGYNVFYFTSKWLLSVITGDSDSSGHKWSLWSQGPGHGDSENRYLHSNLKPPRQNELMKIFANKTSQFRVFKHFLYSMTAQRYRYTIKEKLNIV